MKPATIKGANKDAKIYVQGRSATLHNLLFCPHDTMHELRGNQHLSID